jgi:F0F1-type ATP synthase assembly protein I
MEFFKKNDAQDSLGVDFACAELLKVLLFIVILFELCIEILNSIGPKIK